MDDNLTEPQPPQRETKAPRATGRKRSADDQNSLRMESEEPEEAVSERAETPAPAREEPVAAHKLAQPHGEAKKGADSGTKVSVGDRLRFRRSIRTRR